MQILIIYLAFFAFICSSDGSVVKKGYFWQVTDFHYDANYSTNGDPNTMCHSDRGKSHSNSIYGNYLCDSPMKLIISAINAMQSIHPNPDFIFWTGDSVPHVNDTDLDQTKIYYNIGNVTEKLMKVFPNTSIYPVLGNHDEYPKDAFPPGATSYYSNILSVSQWSKLLGENESTVFKTGGYYSSSLNPNLLVLGLNTNLYYGFNPLTQNSTDPSGQLKWLEKQLKQAQISQKKVIIISHIPPGLFELSSGLMWFSNNFNEKYVHLVSQYSGIIAAQIYGHEHTDSFRILKDSSGTPSGMLFLSPAVTPWKSTLPGVGSNNPSIRLYEYNRDTGEILDYHQYFLNLSAVITTNKDKWEKEYDAKKDYGLTSLTPVDFMKAAKSFRNNPKLFKKYIQYNSVSQNLNPDCNETCKRVHVCSITELRMSDFNDCLNKPNPTLNPEPHSHPHTTPRPKAHVPRYMVIVICTLAGTVFVLAVIVAIICIKKHTVFIPHQYSRFSSPVGKGPIN
ncbi:acid sphingomyelinase-like phosphodiesterase 3b isoform X2 [Mytilus edulis]|uniref:acid sphingomyelinase-like phosphodiesterase 3b isoform X1 n=1 Tax=Mytilus edulis TaxID=6550 RepID=UPI0039EFB079